MSDVLREMNELLEELRAEAERTRMEAATSLSRSLVGMCDDLARALGALTALCADREHLDDEAVEAGRQALLAWQVARQASEQLLVELAAGAEA